jgi:hypothetical protein
MSFVRANPGGWASGATVTSAQLNSLDIDHAAALDKSVAGDTISGVVNIASGGQINAAPGGGQIVASRAGGITASLAGGIVSSVNGAIALGAGAADWVTFNGTPRTMARTFPLSASALAAGWAATGGIYYTGPANANTQVFRLEMPHDGATLSSVSVTLSVTGPHSGVPTNLPAIEVIRLNINTGVAVVTNDFLSTSNPQSFTPTPGSGALWDASQLTQLLTYTCNQHNVIDHTKYAYFVIVIDENGSNSVAGNLYLGVTLNYTAINDVRFA